MKRLFLVLLLVVGVGGCAGAPPPCSSGPAPRGEEIYLVDHGWHVDLAIPSPMLRGNMAVFRRIFPGLQVLMVGFGKRTFMMAPVTTIGDLLIGPFPGSGAILAVGLSAPPDQAYSDGTEAILDLPPGGAERLSDFLWRTFLVKDGMPVEIAKGFSPGSVFYATRTGYSGVYTCNTWAADALHEAGLKVDPLGVIFAGQAMARAARVSRGVCAIKDNP
ncbi:MAG TPA: DUF2459 domain-containing protein [Acetobacteraceae bacterium]|nr:DUF2459 domain-containing protein [Acetobacteraceae bacterium]